MPGSPEFRDILLRLVEIGLLRIRALGWAGQPERCAIEADHIHNLPSLLGDCSEERLRYYWDVERIAYMGQTPEADLALWQPLWEDLKAVGMFEELSSPIR